MRTRLLLLTAAVAVALASALPAQAAVTVQFGLAAVAEGANTSALCSVSVPAGASGLTVLDRAVAQGCIESYEKQYYAQWNAHLITCINRVCNAPPEAMFLTYWLMYVNGTAPMYSVDAYRAAAGDTLVFSYESWTTFCVEHPDEC